jgi:hypothetical protein
VLARLRAHHARFSITVRQPKPVRRAIAAIGEAAWVDIPYPDSGVAQVAETPFRSDRLIVRRIRHRTDQGQLFPTWDYHPAPHHHSGTSSSITNPRRLATCGHQSAIVDPGSASIREASVNSVDFCSVGSRRATTAQALALRARIVLACADG